MLHPTAPVPVPETVLLQATNVTGTVSGTGTGAVGWSMETAQALYPYLV